MARRKCKDLSGTGYNIQCSGINIKSSGGTFQPMWWTFGLLSIILKKFFFMVDFQSSQY